MQHEISRFCADPKLAELIELAKGNADLLDLMTPRENQHSDILAWCFNAREGHGQGDAILKDFLLTTVRSIAKATEGKKKASKSPTTEFAKRWSAGRILSSSFTTALFFREYSLPAPQAAGRQRLDLVIVDIPNRVLVVIENKVGLKLKKEQLDGYFKGVTEHLLKKPVFHDFSTVFVVLDMNYDDDDDDAETHIDPRWAMVNYDWLKPSARRAELAVERGNHEALLLLSYCRQQTGWDSDKSRALTQISCGLYHRHSLVVDKVRELAKQLSNPADWNIEILDDQDQDGQILRLYLQNKSALDRLICISPLDVVHQLVAESKKYLISGDDDYIARGKVWICFRPNVEINQTEDYWPLYVRLRIPQNSAGKIVFKVSLVWSPKYAVAADAERVVSLINTKFPKACAESVNKNEYILDARTGSIKEAADRSVWLLDQMEKLIGHQ